MTAQAPPQEHPPAEQPPAAAEAEEEIADAEIVPEDDAGEEAGQELIVRESQAALTTARIVAGETPEEVIQKATQIANAMAHLVDAQGFAVQMGGKKPHLEIAAWQSLGALLGALGGEALHPETLYSRPTGERTEYHVHETRKKWGKVDGKRQVIETIERDFDVEGNDWEAKVEIKTAAGVVVGSDEGMCSRTESQWAEKPDPALKSMASTRAQSRAYRQALGWVVAIAGYNTTPAEEMPAQPAAAPTEAVPPFGPFADGKFFEQTRNAIGYVLDVPADDPSVQAVVDLAKKVLSKSDGGFGTFDAYMPRAAAAGIAALAAEVKRTRENDPEPPASAGEGPVPASVPAPELTGTPQQQLEQLRNAGCICPEPFGPDMSFDDACPIESHSIPF